MVSPVVVVDSAAVVLVLVLVLVLVIVLVASVLMPPVDVSGMVVPSPELVSEVCVPDEVVGVEAEVSPCEVEDGGSSVVSAADGTQATSATNEETRQEYERHRGIMRTLRKGGHHPETPVARAALFLFGFLGPAEDAGGWRARRPS